MKKLIMTVGLPRSGKSTWAQGAGCPIVCPDSIRLALHGQAFIGHAEPMVWVMAKYMVKSLFLAGHDTVILDATNTTRKRRDEWKSKSWIREYRRFDATPKECIERACFDEREDLIPIIERMAEQFEDIQDDEDHML